MTPSTAQRIEHQIDAAIFSLEAIPARTANLPDYLQQNIARRMTLDAMRYVEFAWWLLIRETQP
ncbi:hypothetical protein A9R05_06705 [Burkholderia sp. KK1]|nr:hypothetical protein A9R05_06705 [Burkholderia sp. KK1]